MALVIVKDRDFIVMQPVRESEGASRFGTLVSRWMLSRSSLRKGWERFIQRSGRRVPYRVWSRHGAYLEVHREQKRH